MFSSPTILRWKVLRSVEAATTIYCITPEKQKYNEKVVSYYQSDVAMRNWTWPVNIWMETLNLLKKIVENVMT